MANTSAIGVSISSKRVRAVYFDETMNPAGRSEAELSPDVRVSEQVRSLLSQQNVGTGLRLCIAVPGMVETSSSRVVDSRIAALNGVDLKAELAGIGGEIEIENDANAAAVAEFKLGAGNGARNLFFVSLGEGVGSGLILNGELWRGHDGFAGEFGSIVVDEGGTRLEDVASIENIVRRTRNRFHQDSTSTLRKLSEDDISFEDILSAADLGDDLALLMLERTGTFVGTALASVINLLNIERIVIGGEIIRTPSAVLDAVISGARQSSSARAFNATTIALSELDEFAPAIGAGLLASNLS